MRYTDKIDCYSNEDSAFAHREVSERMADRIRFKKLIVGTIRNGSGIKKLSEREEAVYDLFWGGKSYKEISEILNLSIQTCKNYKCRAERKIELLTKYAESSSV